MNIHTERAWNILKHRSDLGLLKNIEDLETLSNSIETEILDYYESVYIPHAERVQMEEVEVDEIYKELRE